jgi:hypothetical protein
MEIPPSIAIDKNIRKGSVYYFTNDKFISTEPHYHIVLNENPLDDELLLLVVSSSKIDNVKRINKNNPSETVVEICPTAYPAFTKKSIIDCNKPYITSKKELRNKFISGKLKLKCEMDIDLVNILINGVLKSKIVENSLKRILERNLP